MSMKWFSGLAMIAVCALPLLLAACSDSSVRGSGDDDDDDTDTDTNTSTDSPCSLSELETFDTEIPLGWTVVDHGTSAGAWEWTDVIPETFPVAIVSDGGALIDSQAAGEDSVQDDDLVSPLYDLGECTSATLTYHYNFQKDLVGTDVGEVYVVPGGDGTPLLLASYDSDSSASALENAEHDITATQLGEETSFTIVFHYEGAFDLGFYVDNVRVEGVP